MRLTRVYFDGALTPGNTVELGQSAGAHLAKVLRARSGDELIFFNGDGAEFSGTIEAVKGSRVSASIGAGRAADRESPLSLTLMQCIPRGDRMDFIVQKATELGVARIVPLLSERSVVRLDESQAASKQAHWRAVAVSACEQCGRNRLPQIGPPQLLLNWLGALAPMAAASALRLVLEPEREHPSAAAQFDRAADPAIAAADIAIGPEGGFTVAELEAFQLCGFSRIGLGPRILRTETAALAAIALLQARYGDMSLPSDSASRAADG